MIPLSEKTRTEKIYSAFFEQEFPADLTLMVVWLAVTIGVIYLPILNDSILRIILSLPMVLFIPGTVSSLPFFQKKEILTSLSELCSPLDFPLQSDLLLVWD